MTYFVAMNDSQLSKRANDKIHKRVFRCETMEEADTVYDNALTHRIYNRISITEARPEYSEKTHDVFYHSKRTLPNWYKRNYFKERPYISIS